MIQLTELIKNIDDLEIFGSNQIAVNNVSNNSKKIKSGDIYVAIKGSNFDGHDFIDDAIKEGAVCIICEVLQTKPHWETASEYKLASCYRLAC